MGFWRKTEVTHAGHRALGMIGLWWQQKNGMKDIKNMNSATWTSMNTEAMKAKHNEKLTTENHWFCNSCPAGEGFCASFKRAGLRSVHKGPLIKRFRKLHPGMSTVYDKYVILHL